MSAAAGTLPWNPLFRPSLARDNPTASFLSPWCSSLTPSPPPTTAGAPPPPAQSAAGRPSPRTGRLGPSSRDPRPPTGTIDEPREGCDVKAEPEDGEWWTHLEDGWMDPDVHDRRKMLAEHLSSN